MDEFVQVAGSENKAAAELEWVFAQTMLADADGFGAFAGLHVVAAKQMQQVGVAQFDGAIGLALFVDQQRESDAGLLAEVLGVTDVAQSDGGKLCAFLENGLLVFAQLRDVFAAEDSTVMAEKNKHGRATGPQGAETNGMAVNVGKRNARELAAE